MGKNSTFITFNYDHWPHKEIWCRPTIMAKNEKFYCCIKFFMFRFKSFRCVIKMWELTTFPSIKKHVSHWWWQYLDFLFVTLYIARAACGAVVHRVLPVISSNHLQAFHLGLNTTNKEPSWNLDAIYSDIILKELIFSKEKNSWMHFDLNRHHWHSFS